MQRERIVAYCKMFQHNLIAIYADDHTGRNLSGPDSNGACGMVETDRSLMSVVSMDRISRNVGDWTYLLDAYFGKGKSHKLLAFDWCRNGSTYSDRSDAPHDAGGDGAGEIDSPASARKLRWIT